MVEVVYNTEEMISDVVIYGFWKQVTAALFDVININLDAGYYLFMALEKYLVKVEAEKKSKYIQTCLEHRHNLPCIIYSVDIIPGVGVKTAQWHMSLTLSYNMTQ